MKAIQKIVPAVVAVSLTASAPRSSAADLTPEQAKAIAVEAYVYTYPLVSMDVTRLLMTNVPPGVKPGLGPANAFHHLRTYPPADFREVVRPNFDTLYSSAWLDLTKEPMVLSFPDSCGRYYLAPLLDMWSEAYASPGKRTSGTAAAHWAVVPPGWTGALPKGVERIDSPTVYNWVIGRTQTNGPDDYAAVNKFQDGFTITPLSQFGKPAVAPPAFVPDATVDMKTPPLRQVKALPGDKYFAYAAELMKLHAPHLSDWSTVARMKRLGIVPGQSFDIARADPVVREALLAAPEAGQKQIDTATAKMARVANGWRMFDTAGVYGNAYLVRAVWAVIGLGVTPLDEAVYPIAASDADGKPLDGTNDYVLHFSKEELPPVEAFWSVTMYDAEGFPVANPLNRLAIGDRDKLQYNPDGSLDIYMQNASPGKDKESNWLPAPKTKLGITMRLYAPRPEVANGTWAPPAIRKVR